MALSSRKYSTYCSSWVLDGTDNGNSYYNLFTSGSNELYMLRDIFLRD